MSGLDDCRRQAEESPRVGPSMNMLPEAPKPAAKSHVNRHLPEAVLCEVAWEVCQQLGGINTVVRSKAPAMVEKWGRHYCLIGPYNAQSSPAEFEETPPAGPFGRTVKAMREAGYNVYFGRWLVNGHPNVVLLDLSCAMPRLAEIKYAIWEKEGVDFRFSNALLDQVLAFGYLVEMFFRLLCAEPQAGRPVVAQFHEWMASTCIPALRRSKLPVATVFTTHATLLGRYLAMSESNYYDRIPHTDWREAARRFNIEAEVTLERAAAQQAHVLTTVSEVTGYECEHLLGRPPDVLLPNGLSIERFVVLHEFHNLHRMYKERIHEFVMGHFFPSYTFNLDRTLYFVTSGRYEYTNKGFDLTIEAMARLNQRLKEAGTDRTIVFFLITRAACNSINPDVLRTRALMDEIRRDCEAIQKQVGERFFSAVTRGEWPHLEALMDDYWRLRLRRDLQAWKSTGLPSVVTHKLTHEADDAILNHIRRCQLSNRPEDPVKVVYHPDFIAPSQPLFLMDYDQMVRGCHLGLFPSLYEPWGYAPLECVILGIPTITSDLSGFGTYVMRHIPDHEERGITVLRRRHVPFGQAVDALADTAFRFALQERRERIAQRNRVEAISEQFDWTNLGAHYHEAHELALQRVKL